jgi:hypothetical protein
MRFQSPTVSVYLIMKLLFSNNIQTTIFLKSTSCHRCIFSTDSFLPRENIMLLCIIMRVKCMNKKKGNKNSTFFFWVAHYISCVQIFSITTDDNHLPFTCFLQSDLIQHRIQTSQSPQILSNEKRERGTLFLCSCLNDVFLFIQQRRSMVITSHINYSLEVK